MSDIDPEEYPISEWPYKHWDTFSGQWLPCRDKYVKVPDDTTPFKFSKTIRAKPRTQNNSIMTPSLQHNRVVLSGRKLAGKDHVAEENGYTIYGFADPMYELAEHFIGSSDKSEPGVRLFLRKVGAWGRGLVSEDFPRSVARHRITEFVRSHGYRLTGMGSVEVWTKFGETEDFWIEVLLDRLEDADGKIATTNGRFPNEINRLSDEAGFAHFHIMCSPKTRRHRHQETGEEMDDLSDGIPPTERLAVELDALAGQDPHGVEIEMAKDLRADIYSLVESRDSVIWNDPRRESAGSDKTLGDLEDEEGTKTLGEAAREAAPVDNATLDGYA